MKMTGRVLVKNLFVIIFAVILIAAFLPATVYAAEASVTFGSERYDKDNGEQFPVGVYINGGSTIADYYVELRYDCLRLKYISGADEVDEENGILFFEDSVSAERVKRWLTFEAISGGEARLVVDTAVATAPSGEDFNMTSLQEVSVYIAGADTVAEMEAAREALNAGADNRQESDAENGAAEGGLEPDSGKADGFGGQISVAVGNPEVAVGQASVMEDGVDADSKTQKALGSVVVEGIGIVCVIGVFITIIYLCHKKRGSKWFGTFGDKKTIRSGIHVNWRFDGDTDYDKRMEYDEEQDSWTVENEQYDANAEYDQNAEYDSDEEYGADQEICDMEAAEFSEGISSDGDAAFAEEDDPDEMTEADEVSAAVLEDGEKTPIIKVENVTMKFKVATGSTSGLKDYVIQKLRKQITTRDLLALDNVSFDIFEGEVVGIIGTNGSGKSTLLKIISGAMKPTGGQVTVDKSKIQILTLGTGFDIELTARENVYLNGSIIGYSREFINEHYDEIVEFAELEGFMDTKVKNFSSGMISRLGFSIATVGEAAEILILDEVLSVGDEFFRKKSLKRIKEMIHGGSTVIMVSHGMGTILENCVKVVWIEKGVLQMVGDTKAVCTAYRKMERTSQR